MIRQSSSAGPCKYLNNNYKKKLCKIFCKIKKGKKILPKSVKDACPLAPIFIPSKLGFSHSNSISRRFN